MLGSQLDSQLDSQLRSQRLVPRFASWLALGLTWALTSALAPGVAHAGDTAAYVRPDALEPEGTSHLGTVGLVGTYARVLDADDTGGAANLATFGIRSRFFFFRPVAYCAGLDADIGGSDEGVVYGATAYVAGLGGRWGAGNVIALCGGVGVDGVANAVPAAARFPAELSVGLSLGPVRPTAWLRPAWLVGADARREGAGVDFVDELEAGLSVRIGRQHRYWSEVSAGGGPAFGMTVRQMMGTTVIGGFVGIELGAEQ